MYLLPISAIAETGARHYLFACDSDHFVIACGLSSIELSRGSWAPLEHHARGGVLTLSTD